MGDLDGGRVPEILPGGFNRGYASAVLAVLDGGRIAGVHRQREGTPLWVPHRQAQTGG
jgi:hypothetical protein